MNRLVAPLPDLQVQFFHRLQEVRAQFLLDALLATVAEADVPEIDRELATFATRRALRKLARLGLRGEIVLAVPCLLRRSPRLLGYYRLLLGFSQKEFYGKEFGLGRFRALEDRGVLAEKQEAQLPELCRCLCESGEYLLEQVGELSQPAAHELTLLTLGPQLRGGALNLLGASATEQVFSLIKTVVAPAVVDARARSIELQNAAGRKVLVEFANDPDICIREELASGKWRPLVAIEIKGGKDFSNIHNRLGEAEKSHLSARKHGFVECWTMVGVASLDLDLARNRSPSTDRFYHIRALAQPTSPEFQDFRDHLRSRVGIRDE